MTTATRTTPRPAATAKGTTTARPTAAAAPTTSKTTGGGNGTPGNPFTPARREYLIRQLTTRKLRLKGQLKAVEDEIAMHREALKAIK